MIISHKHKFIFIHCRKAAGSSVAVSLARYLGKSDIQLSAIVDGIEHGVYPPRRMIREALTSPSLRGIVLACRSQKPFWEYVAAASKNKYSKSLGPIPQHAPADRIAQAFPAEWDKYYKFCIVRNPWDQLVSDFFWSTRNQSDRISFPEFIDALYDGRDLPNMANPDRANWSRYTINNKIVVDKVVHYESLVPGMEEVLREIGICWDGWLPKAKAIRTDKGSMGRDSYRRHYTTQLMRKVQELYHDEIDAHGYEF